MDFRLPVLGEGVIEVELVAWLVQPGDRVSRGQKLFEVITDKASIDVPSPFAGVVSALKGELGQQIKVGEVILTYAPSGEAETAGSSQTKSASSANAVDGQSGSRHAAAASSGNGSTETSTAVAEPTAAAPAAGSPTSLPAAAPSVRQMAKSLGVDLSHVQGSGPGGRVLVEDLTRHVKEGQAGGSRTATKSSETSAAEGKSEYGVPGTRVKLLGLRRKIAEHMVLSKRTIPHYTYIDECEVTELLKLRKSLRDNLARAGEKTTTLAFYVKAAVAALKEVPIVNASVDEAAGEIVLHPHYHIGIATSTPRGLIVPVVHNADQKGLLELGREIEDLTAAARDGSIGVADLRGGTFTITAIGSIGGLITTPVINHPEAAILGIGKVVKRPVYDSTGNIRPADILYLCISFDHRVVDGAVGAVFGNALCRWLQNPATLLLADSLG